MRGRQQGVNANSLLAKTSAASHLISYPCLTPFLPLPFPFSSSPFLNTTFSTSSLLPSCPLSPSPFECLVFHLSFIYFISSFFPPLLPFFVVSLNKHISRDQRGNHVILKSYTPCRCPAGNLAAQYLCVRFCLSMFVYICAQKCRSYKCKRVGCVCLCVCVP